MGFPDTTARARDPRPSKVLKSLPQEGLPTRRLLAVPFPQLPRRPLNLAQPVYRGRLLLAVWGTSLAMGRGGSWGLSRVLSPHPCELSDGGTTDRLWKEESRRVHTDGQGDGQTDKWLPVGRAPWAPCLGEGSFSALILPCWGDLHKGVGELGGGGRQDRLPTPQAAPPSPLPCCRVGSMELGSSGWVPGTPPGG